MNSNQQSSIKSIAIAVHFHCQQDTPSVELPTAVSCKTSVGVEAVPADRCTKRYVILLSLYSRVSGCIHLLLSFSFFIISSPVALPAIALDKHLHGDNARWKWYNPASRSNAGHQRKQTKEEITQHRLHLYIPIPNHRALKSFNLLDHVNSLLGHYCVPYLGSATVSGTRKVQPHAVKFTTAGASSTTMDSRRLAMFPTIQLQDAVRIATASFLHLSCCCTACVLWASAWLMQTCTRIALLAVRHSSQI